MFTNPRIGSSHSVCILRNSCCSKVRNILGNADEGAHFIIYLQTDYPILHKERTLQLAHLSNIQSSFE